MHEAKSCGAEMTLYWHNAGPLLVYTKDSLIIEDLNPEQKMHWRIGRWDMFKIGLRCIWAAITEREVLNVEDYR